MIPKCFEEYPNKKFKLISVNDINYIYPHKYSVIFQDIETLEDYEEFILPEKLRGSYILGNTYSFNGLEDENHSKINSLHVPKSKVTIHNSFRIKDCVQFNDDFGLSEDNRFFEQNCFIYETKKYIYLIPHYVIANRYYFVSTSIKKALSDGLFKSLYYEDKGYKLVNSTLYIKTKKILKDEQVPLIARMITNETSEKNFMFFYKTVTKYKLKYGDKKDIYRPVMMGFPFENNESFKLQCNILYLGNIYSHNKFKSFDLRKVVMITHIFGDKIPYNFKHLKQEVYKENVLEEMENINESQSIVKNNPTKKGKITTSNPSDRYVKDKESLRVKNIYDFSDINIEKKEIIQDSSRTFHDLTDEEVDESFDRSKQGSQGNRIKEKLLDDDIMKNSFRIDDFYILIEQFINYNNLNEYFISELVDLENHDESGINKFYIDYKKELNRKLIYGYFIFDNLVINFIEVEHNIYWEKNTWYFISIEPFSEIQVQSIVNMYIIKNQSTKQMLETIKSIGAIKFFMSRHDGINLSEKKVDDWCKNLKLGIGRCKKYQK